MTVNGVTTMNSLDIAELVGKRHDNVVRDIEKQIGALGGLLRFEDTYINKQNGQSYICYNLPYRETMILVSGYSVELRARVIDRWLELEKKNLIPDFGDPAAAARAWADQYEARKIAETRVDRLIHDNRTFTSTEIAKELNMKSAQELHAKLQEKGILYKDHRGIWLLYSQYAGRDLQRIKDKEVNGKIVYYAEWTGVGRDWLLGIFA